ncbi:MAG TPA: thiol-disulfide oxidoreductase DCC family protein [Pseudoxanthomonas sp.]|nr:thiol-disulfide oxidoreductase DCC family protein [Pseudoxanthomonas sp.]
MNRAEVRIVVFDGVCALCSGWVRFLLRHDRAGRYRFAAMQTAVGRRLLAENGLDADDPVSFLLLEGDAARTDSDAILAVLTGLGGPWRLAGLARSIPAALRDPAYRWLARNRYRRFGRSDTCLVPDPSLRGRFLGP